jgi:hypothetical protein
MQFERGKSIFALAFQTLILSATCAGADDPWQSLKELPHNLGLLFVERSMTCQSGQIKAVAAQSVLVRTDRSDITVEKSSLIRVRLGSGGQPVPPSSPHMVLATVYSGRSSWADVIAFAPFQNKLGSNRFPVRMSVNTTGGKLHQGRLQRVTDSEITLADAFGKESTIAKTEVSRLAYIREKPLSDEQEYYWDELVMFRIFDPLLYPRLFHLGDKIRVRLYDSSVPEDNSPLECK